MHAASEDDIPVMKLLLGFGADLNALNEESENALGFSVPWKKPEAINLLVAVGADINNTDDSGPAELNSIRPNCPNGPKELLFCKHWVANVMLS